MLGHDEIAHLNAYFLPSLGLIANRFRVHDGAPRLRWYIDIASIVPGQGSWQATDFYLDVVVHLDGWVEVLEPASTWRPPLRAT
jgi:predicted RNA-binding protein associated with RNAse of E/G family